MGRNAIGQLERVWKIEPARETDGKRSRKCIAGTRGVDDIDLEYRRSIDSFGIERHCAGRSQCHPNRPQVRNPHARLHVGYRCFE
jgi:hypothetical protein